MKLAEEKQRLKSEIDLIEDESIIAAIDEVLQYSKLKSEAFPPLTAEDLIARAIESEVAIKEGRVISLDDLRNQSKNW